VVRRRHCSNEEKGRIVSEAIAPGAVVADVARRYDLVPQQLSNWIRTAKDGRFALPADAMPSFVPVVVEPAQANKAAHERRPVGIEIVIGTIKVRVPGGANTRDIEAVLRAVRRSQVRNEAAIPRAPMALEFLSWKIMEAKASAFARAPPSSRRATAGAWAQSQRRVCSPALSSAHQLVLAPRSLIVVSATIPACAPAPPLSAQLIGA
jgi:transposase